MPANLSAELAGKRVLVIGDVMLDEYLSGRVRRVSQEAPVPVVQARNRTCVPGGAANAAANVVALGGRAVLGGVVGRDSRAGRLREVLEQHGVETDALVVDPQRPTTTKARIVAHGQQIVRVDTEQCAPLPAPLEDILLRRSRRALETADACILSDYDKGVVSTHLAECLIGAARRAGKPIVVDPKGTYFAKYRGATVITPNLQEAQRALKREAREDADLLRIGRQLLEIVEGSALLITRGAQGMSLLRNGFAPMYIPTEARDVFDVTGAGDTVVGTLALALAADIPLERAVQLANHAAGIVVGKFGTATVTSEDLVRAQRLAGPTLCRALPAHAAGPATGVHVRRHFAHDERLAK
jgi:D-beta-D-heptose 7-phosphate kinase/D-beta-D-heptose 1-phosphate adenosyltransferase